MSLKIMKIQRKYLIIGVAVLVVVALLLLLFLLLRKNLKYPEEPINQTSLAVNEKEIILGNTNLEEGLEYPLFLVSDTTKYSFVKSFAEKLNLGVASSEEGEYYEWRSEAGMLLYSLDRNTIIFELKEGLEWSEVELTKHSFNRFLKTYFGEDWNYVLFDKEKRAGGEIVYYAKRTINETDVIEMREHKGQTDYLALKDGKIIYGKLMLTVFTPSRYKVPLVTKEELSSYLLQANYPKEIYPRFEAVSNSLLGKVDYLSPEFEKVAESIDNCSTKAATVIYYYKSFDQKLLTPVYKLNMDCDVSYKKEVYSIPSTAYVSAIGLDYLNISE